ncbi:MAG: hypothetical protein ACKOW2_00945 [Sphingobacteriaceae bacterium]
MKKIMLISLIALGTLSVSQSSAQISVNVNIGSQPLWGPVGYDRVDYYYLPDIEAYYSVPRGQFIYVSNGRWVFSASLPGRYAGYNLYNCYKVVVNRPTPYLDFKNDRIKYAKYRGWSGKQKAIKFSDDPRYYAVKGHPHGMPPGQAKHMPGPREDDGNGKGGKRGH